jgi:tight adherence protein C
MLLIGAVVGLTFAAVAVLVTGWSMGTRTARARERISRVQAPTLSPGSPIAQELQKSLYERVIAPIVARISEGVLSATPGGAVEAARAKIEAAGNPASINVATFMVLRGISMATGVVGALVLMALWRDAAMIHKAGAMGLVAYIGAMLPTQVLDTIIHQRQYAIRKSIPDLIDLLVVSAEAGTGLDGALGEVVRRKKGPLPDEFARVLAEIRLGKRRQEAWQDLATRCGVDDVKNLVAALHQAEELGVSIANTLRAQSDSIRTARSIRIRAAAATLSVKMLFPLIFCIFPALFVVVLGPGLMSIDTAFKGMGW